MSNRYEYSWEAGEEEQPQISFFTYAVAVLSLYSWRLTQTSSTCDQGRTYLSKCYGVSAVRSMRLSHLGD